MTTLRAAALLLLPFAVACSNAASTTEGVGESTSHLEQGPEQDTPRFTCTGPIENPSCDVKPFIENAWDLAQQDPVDNGVDVAGSAAECIGTLVAAGFVVYGTGGVAPVVITAAGIWDAVQRAASCYDTVKYLNEIGLLSNIDCALRPEINTPQETACECTYQCNAGVEDDIDRGYTGMTKYKYGFSDRIGSANCHCTDDPKAVSCQLNCKTWASDDPSDCTCSATF